MNIFPTFKRTFHDIASGHCFLCLLSSILVTWSKQQKQLQYLALFRYLLHVHFREHIRCWVVILFDAHFSLKYAGCGARGANYNPEIIPYYHRFHLKNNHNKAFNCADKPHYNSYLEYRDKWPKWGGHLRRYIYFLHMTWAFTKEYVIISVY